MPRYKLRLVLKGLLAIVAFQVIRTLTFRVGEKNAVLSVGSKSSSNRNEPESNIANVNSMYNIREKRDIVSVDTSTHQPEPGVSSRILSLLSTEEDDISNPANKELWNFREKMRSRLEMVKDSCYDGVSSVSYKSVRPYVIADKAQSLLYCPLFKAASSTWIRMMLQMKGVLHKANDHQSLVRLRNRTFRPLRSFSPVHQSDPYKTRFLVVRHPLERLLSCYRDKYEGANNEYYNERLGKEIVITFRRGSEDIPIEQVEQLLAKVDEDAQGEMKKGNPYANPVGPTFLEFVKYVIGPDEDDEQWRPYHLTCAPCSIEYNFILRFEEMDSESGLFLQHLNSSVLMSTQKHNAYRGPPTADVSCSYYSQLSKTLLANLVAKYEADFILFGYSTDHYMQCAS